MSLNNLSENWWAELDSSKRDDRLKEVLCLVVREGFQKDALQSLLDTNVTTYLWENFSELSTEYHIAILALLSNYLYYSLNDTHLLELFCNDSRFDSIIEFILAYTTKQQDGEYSEHIQSQMIQFMNSVFQNPHFLPLRKVTKKLTSIGNWCVLPNVNMLVPGNLQEIYQETPPETWIYDLIQLNQSKDVQSLLLTLITQVPTRRFIAPLLKYLHYVSYIETFFPHVYSDRGFQLIIYYLAYPIDDLTGQLIPQYNFQSSKISTIDRIHLALFELDKSLFEGLKSNFSESWSHLSIEGVKQIATSLEISNLLAKICSSEADYKIFVYNEILHLQRVTEYPLVIDKKSIFYPSTILPRIGGQYMDGTDFSFRHSLLFHAEICYLIFDELTKSLKRISIEQENPLRFNGSSRKLCLVDEIVTQEIKVWSLDVPIRENSFTAEFIVDIQHESTWSELKRGDFLVLLQMTKPNPLEKNIPLRYGVQQMSLGKINMLEVTRKGKSLTITVKLESHMQSANMAFIPERLNYSNVTKLFERSQKQLDLPDWYSSILHDVDVSSFPYPTKDNIYLTNVQWTELAKSGFNIKNADPKRRKGTSSLSSPFRIKFTQDNDVLVKSSPLTTSKAKENLSGEQMEVILSTLRNRLTVVDGVPGAGKSLISAIIANHYYRNFGGSTLIVTASAEYVTGLLDCPGFRIYQPGKVQDFDKELKLLLNEVHQIVKQLDIDRSYSNDLSSSLLFLKEFVNPEWEKFKNNSAAGQQSVFCKIFGTDTPEGMAEGFRKLLQIFEGITFLRDITSFPANQRPILLKKKAAFGVLTLPQLIEEENVHCKNLIIDDAEQVPEFVSALNLEDVSRMVLLGSGIRYSKFNEDNSLSKFGHNCSLFHKLTAKFPPLKMSVNLRQPKELFNLYSADPKHFEKCDKVQVIKVAGKPVQIEHANNQNVEEAEYCVYLYMLLKLTYPTKRVFIYTPFSAQKLLLEKIIKHRCPQNGLNVRLFSSIEQCDYSILSYVNNSSWNADFKLHINVLSRPKLQLFVFVHPKLLFQRKQPFPLLREQSSQLNVNGTTIKSKSELITLLKTKMGHR